MAGANEVSAEKHTENIKKGVDQFLQAFLTLSSETEKTTSLLLVLSEKWSPEELTKIGVSEEYIKILKGGK